MNRHLEAMETFRRLRRHIAWLALCAMCLGAVAPAMSKWLAATQGVAWVQVCSETGSEQVAISTAREKSQAPAAGDTSCPYCTLTHHVPVIPAASAASVPRAPPVVLAYADVAAPPPSTRPQWRAHVPRAPPPHA
ncbi:DUF2946 domain-containing protein [Pigmentiphaga sp. NML080357]|uniref:DUF2946 domain-containing protein n=1 Tax=Pigmentiphaga sp. NML080357 TaxID=2008675 RepID=UPI001302EA6E|nr:DUF2946 domain-containing protein [Pigmentiphaga sp. NML080357]